MFSDIIENILQKYTPHPTSEYTVTKIITKTRGRGSIFKHRWKTKQIILGHIAFEKIAFFGRSVG